MQTMLARLTGTLNEKSAGQLIIDVGGVGYEVFIPCSTYYELGGVGEKVTLRIYTHVKENDLSLYGFLTQREKELFNLLIQISGIGPKLGVIILSGLPAEELAEAVVAGDLVRLTSIPGVGKKTAERIVLELKEKLDKLIPDRSPEEARNLPGGVNGDVVSALVNLGYQRTAAEKAVREVSLERSDTGFESVLRGALSHLSGS